MFFKLQEEKKLLKVKSLSITVKEIKRSEAMDLIRFCTKGDIVNLKSLITGGADINCKDPQGRTALIEAAWSGHLEIVKLLIARGADVNAADKSGFTALMRASEEGYTFIVKALIKHGANVNCCGTVKGKTPLMLAAENGHLKIIDILLEAGSEINKSDYFEETALSRAYNKEKFKVAEMLESRGAIGRMERSSYSQPDRETRTIPKAALAHWSAEMESDDDFTD
ncbi:Ankyrin 1 [Chitinispirillum alkaliphilum]|nr:Ankyrin 1 [Chitinispirillum alkaliphilum]